jgi:hypothetical protein
MVEAPHALSSGGCQGDAVVQRAYGEQAHHFPDGQATSIRLPACNSNPPWTAHPRPFA